LGLHPRPCWGGYIAPPDPLAVFNGSTSKGWEGEGEGEGKGRGGGRRRRGDLPDHCQTASYVPETEHVFFEGYCTNFVL